MMGPVLIFTMIRAQLASKFANKSFEKILNRTLEIVLTVIG